MNNNLIGFLLGNSIKIVDDHYDLNIYDSQFINFIKSFGLLLLIYWNFLGFEYNLIFIFEIIICYFAKQIDNDFYKKVSLLIITIFIFYLLFNKKKIFVDNFNPMNLFLYFILALIIIIIESKIFKEEYSWFKLISRIFVISVAITFYFNKENKGIVKNFTSLFIGYFVISIFSISKKLI